MLQPELKEIILENNALFITTEYFRRDLQVKSIPGKPIIVTGSRRAGKSTLLTQIFKDLHKQKDNFLYFNFVDERVRPLSKELLSTIEDSFYQLYPHLQTEKTSWFLDELQLVPDWEYFVERLARNKKNQIFITGSSATLLSKEIASSLRGRPITYELFPFSFKEYVCYHGVDITSTPSAPVRRKIQSLFAKYLEEGGFPETLNLDAAHRKLILSEYYRTMLTRDLIERHSPKDPFVLEHCIKSFFSYVGKSLSFNKLNQKLKSIGIPISTPQLSEYLSWVEDTYFLYQVSLFSDSIQKRRVNPQKIYCIDNGLLLATASFMERKNYGALLENIIFIFLRTLNFNISYGKSSSGQEVDFVFNHAKSEVPQCIQVSVDMQNAETKAREINSLVSFLHEFKLNSGLIITIDEEYVEMVQSKKIQVVPAWKVLLFPENYFN